VPDYEKRGFKTGKDLGVCTPDGKYPLGLLVLELRQGFFASGRQWKFQTSSVYEFDAAQVEAYDARFPPGKEVSVLARPVCHAGACGRGVGGAVKRFSSSLLETGHSMARDS
jgi:hypothetical protein